MERNSAKKILTSKEGLAFAISESPREANGDCVFFSKEEIEYMKAQGFTPEQFKFAWQAKKEDCTWTCLPLEKESHADMYKKPVKNAMAINYSEQIINELRGKRKYEDVE